jgi:hypothetical protein
MNLKDVLNNKFTDIIGFQLSGQEACNDLLFYYRFTTNVNYWEDFDINLQSYHIRAFVVGFESTVSIYDIDLNAIRIEIQVQIEKEKASSTSYFKSFYSLYAATMGTTPSSTSTAPPATNNNAPEPNNPLKIWDNRGGKLLFPLAPSLQFFDAKRRIIRLSIDPFHTLIATADALGRVELYDLNADCFIRLWKGVRDAYLGWHIDEEDTTHLFASSSMVPHHHHHHHGGIHHGGSHNQILGNTMQFNETSMSEIAKSALQLIIFAPLLGLISIYKMKNGPCLRVIPVGMNCKIVPIASSFVQFNRSIQTIIPFACDADTKFFTMVTLNSKYQTEAELSYLADLMDALEMDQSGDDLIAMNRNDSNPSIPFLSLENPKNPLATSSALQLPPTLLTPGSGEGSGSGRHESADHFAVRHSDMRTSVLEAIERGRRIKPPTHFLNNELNKYLYLISGKIPTAASGSSASTHKMNLTDLEKLENKIIYLLKQQKNLLSLFMMLQIIENFELNGFDLDALVTALNTTNPGAPGADLTKASPRSAFTKPGLGGGGGHHVPSGPSSPSSPTRIAALGSPTTFAWIRINDHNKRRFSVDFHKKINEIIREKLQFEETNNKLKTVNPVLFRRITEEIEIRTKLIEVYRHLGEIDTHSNDPNRPRSISTAPSTAGSTNLSSHSHINANSYNLSLTALKEDASQACKGNVFRSESLCWVLRAIKKLESQSRSPGGSMKASSNPMEMKDNTRFSLSPKPPTAVANPRMSQKQIISPLVPGNPNYESPIRHASFTNNGGLNGSGNKRSSFTLTPPNSSMVSSDITLKKLIENNTRNNFTSPTVDVLVSPSSQFNSPFTAADPSKRSVVLPASPAVALSGNTSSASSTILESAVMNFSIFRALHILDGHHELYLTFNLIRTWLESEKGMLPLETYQECLKHSLSIYHFFKSSVAIRAQNFTEILSMLKYYQLNPPHPESSNNKNIDHMNASTSSMSTSLFSSLGSFSSSIMRPSTHLNVGAPPSGLPGEHFYYNIHPNIIYPLLGLIFKSLILGDFSSLHSFYNAMKYESSAFSGIEGLRDFLPCFLEYISKQSLVIVVQDLLGKNISTSPIQRVLRDHLLTFQDLLARYKQYKTRSKAKTPPLTTTTTGENKNGNDFEQGFRFLFSDFSLLLFF